ncbi:hypothetical protein LT330_000356 [Penicillium expansum]|nr:hypothetical protein LT330_000356 [Penicillium expansum]
MDEVKKISCKRCQARKIKCSRILPCSNCVQSNHECEYRQNDARRRPVSHEYLKSLETRLVWYESFVRELKTASNEERDVMLHELSINEDSLDSLPMPSCGKSSTQNTGRLKYGSSGSLQYHGPTSIYVDPQTNKSEQISQPTSFSAHADDMIKLRLGKTLGVSQALIQTCLPLFFLYQYPQLMFVYREAFLADYFENTYSGKYWSYALVFATCALGAPHSPDMNIRNKAGIMAKCAKEIIITYELSFPTPVTIQALLCLAFHEIGQGNTSQGWLFAGMAFRMGQDIGFHRDPTNWVSQDQSITTAQDVEIRRRIYWGCYVVDKFMSLYLGRPVYLSTKDATVHPSEPLADFSPNHEWFGLFDLTLTHSNFTSAQRPQLLNALKYNVQLGDIFQNIMADVFSQRSQEDVSISVYRLSELNIRLNRWLHDLPEHLQWSQWTAQERQLQHHTISLHICLSLNRHFIDSPSDAAKESSRGVCEASCNSVIAMVRQFRNQHGMRTSPLIMVYALVTASIVFTKVFAESNTSPTPQLSFLLKALEECSNVYRIAAEVHSSLRANVVNQRRAQPSSHLHVPGPDFPPENSAESNAFTSRSIHNDYQSSADSNNELRVPSTPSLEIFNEQNLQGSWIDDSLQDTLNWDGVTLDLGQMDGDFRGWFSLGNDS